MKRPINILNDIVQLQDEWSAKKAYYWAINIYHILITNCKQKQITVAIKKSLDHTDIKAKISHDNLKWHWYTRMEILK